ncbi:hypothetical protein [Pseudomonas aeruginosa]|uniref:hypothetical protein n=1 Tax=Pseudomonas aeruginosa TaxID=287 RepID=UPI0034E0C5ED
MMTKHTKGEWYTQNGIAIMGDEGIHVTDVKGLSRTDSENEVNAARIVACVNACDGYTTEQLVALKGGNVKREVTYYADKLCGAEGRYLKAELHRDNLLAALKALLEHEGSMVETGIGMMESDELQEARELAQVAIREVEAEQCRIF